MQTGLDFLSRLSPKHVHWVMSAGAEKTVETGAIIVRAGDEITAVYLVLEGLFGVYTAASGNERVATMGPGDIVGEISFIDDLPPSASVVALEPALVLCIERGALRDKLGSDAQFAQDFYRAAAITLSSRLRHANDVQESRTQMAVEPQAWKRLHEPLSTFKALLHDADRQANKSGDDIADDLGERVREQFRMLTKLLNETLGDPCAESRAAVEQIGLRVQQEFLPYMLLTENAARWYTKPRGYAGDFLSIEYIYENEARGTAAVGRLLDRCFLDLQAAQAVRNRRPLIADLITEVAGEVGKSRTTRLTSLACGPAREVFDVFGRIEAPAELEVHLLDIDLQALAFVAERRDKLRLKKHIHLHNENLVYLATGRKQFAATEQDLVYSIGLIDYFADRFVVQLLDAIHAALAPGGRVVLGNFHPDNPDKAVMDHVLDWKLIHRNEDDMNRLFASSAFGRPCSRILYESQRINLFAECVKAS